jgi:hypothetical protein
MADTLHAEDFQARHLLLAVAYGNESHLALAFVFEAIALAGFGSRFQRQVEWLLAKARELNETLDDPLLRCRISIASGASAFLRFQWKAALPFFEEAERLLQQQTRNTWLERANARLGISRMLYYCGKLPRLHEVLPAMCKDADARGDDYAGIPLRARLALLELLESSDSERSKNLLDALDQVAAGHRYNLKCYFLLCVQMESEFYTREFDRARALIEKHWPRLKAAGLLLVHHVRIEAGAYRAFAALQTGELGTCKVHMRQLERTSVAWSAAMASAIRAGLALRSRDQESGIQFLMESERQFEHADMASHQWSARRLRGELLGGVEGNRLILDADAWMRKNRVAEPSRAARMWLPIV